jgi:hypothetical protein
MEKVSTLRLLHSEASRFRILPLWSWTLAAVELGDEVDRYLGMALDRSKSTALAKVESEAIERAVCRHRADLRERWE